MTLLPRPLRLIAACLLAVLVVACGDDGSGRGDRGGPRLSAEDVALNNRGVALMGHFDYAGARDVFRQVVDRNPAWHDARVNLAIATLNRQTEGDENRALALVDEVLAAEPANLRAHYISGLLQLYQGAIDVAADHFQTVLDGDPSDAFAAYYLAQCVSHSDLSRAAELYTKAIELDPYLRSAYYGAAQVLRRIERMDEAREMLDVYSRFANNPRATLAEFKYTKMGKRGDAQTVDQDAPATIDIEGPLFLAPALIAQLAGAAQDIAVTTVDLQGDGIQDILLSHGGGAGNLTLFAGAEDELQGDADHPLAKIAGIRALAWGDVDNDGNVDVYLCRKGRNQLWLQSDAGQWRRAGKSSGSAGHGGRCDDAMMMDADHDGDLDLVYAGTRGAGLLSNNMDGTFRQLAGTEGLDIGTAPVRRVVAADFDNDRDADLIVLRASPPHAVFVNDRLWRYRAASGFDEFNSARIDALVSADLDADGHIELYAATAGGLLERWRNEGGVFKRDTLASIAAGGDVQIAIAELNGDGRQDLILRDADGIRVLDIAAAGARELFREEGTFGGVLALVDDAARGPSLIAAADTTAGTELWRWSPGAGRAGFTAVRVSGKEELADSMRSNRSGIGTRVALRSGSRWTMADTFDANSGPGQSLQPLALGLGGAARADYVALYWSDGVFQTELDVEGGRIHAIAETQRQLSSCPVIFAWDGERYRFVSDVLGVGGIGFFIEPGRYAEPRPWEYFLLPDGALAARDDKLALKFTEPMEEIAYLDQARLHVYDLAPGWSVLLDERLGTAAPAPTGRPIYYREERLPASVVDTVGRDVLDAASRVDGEAVDPGARDARFIGRTARSHSVTLTFDRPLTDGPGQPVLMADGWVEYPYSQTVFAAWQAGAAYAPPTLEAATADGRFEIVHANFGYPAGMPRRMALPLADLPPDTVALKLTSSLEIYWDRFAVVFGENPGANARVSEAPLEIADVRKSGFAKRYERPQRRPDYIYEERVPLWDSRYLSGYYTALGDARALVQDHDDAFAIIGPGEEVHLEFALAPPAPVDWRRRYVLETRGFAKDMDLYTRDGGTVAPLPVSGARDVVDRERLHSRYNTRFQAGH